MIEPTGQYAMLDSSTLPPDAPAGSLLVFGTEQEVAAIAQRVKLGHVELERRAARRRQQRASRKRNRR